MAFQSKLVLLFLCAVMAPFPTSAKFVHRTKVYYQGVGVPTLGVMPPLVPPDFMVPPLGYGDCDYRSASSDWYQLDDATFWEVGSDSEVLGFRMHDNLESELVYVFDPTKAWVEMSANTSLYDRVLTDGTPNGTYHGPAFGSVSGNVRGEYLGNGSDVGTYTAPNASAPWYDQIGEFHKVTPTWEVDAVQGACRVNNGFVRVSQNFTDADGNQIYPVEDDYRGTYIVPHNSSFPVTWIAWDEARPDTWIKVILPKETPLVIAYAGNGTANSTNFNPRAWTQIVVLWCPYADLP